MWFWGCEFELRAVEHIRDRCFPYALRVCIHTGRSPLQQCREILADVSTREDGAP